MQRKLEPKEMIGRVIKQFSFSDRELLIEVEGGGYIVVTPELDWDNCPELKCQDELNWKRQFQANLIGHEEYTNYLTQEEAEKKKAQEARVAKAVITELDEQNTLRDLMRKHPDVVNQFLDPNTSQVDYNGTGFRRATTAELAAIISGDIPVERQRFPRVCPVGAVETAKKDGD